MSTGGAGSGFWAAVGDDAGRSCVGRTGRGLLFAGAEVILWVLSGMIGSGLLGAGA
jgi:hypothetical protein